MGSTTSKSDSLYKKISKRTRHTNVKSISIKQSDSTKGENNRRHRRARKQEDDTTHTKSMTGDLNKSDKSSSSQSITSTSTKKAKGNGLACYIQSPEPKSPTSLKSDSISLDKKDSLTLISQQNIDQLNTGEDCPRRSQSSSSDVDLKSVQIRNSKAEIKPFKVAYANLEYERDCDSKVVLTGSLLEFGTDLSSDEDESPSRKNGAMLGNWTGTKKTLGSKFLKKLDKKKGSVGKCPAVKSSDGVNGNIFLTEDMDEDLESISNIPLEEECAHSPRELPLHREETTQAEPSVDKIGNVEENLEIRTQWDIPTHETQYQETNIANQSMNFLNSHVLPPNSMTKMKAPDHVVTGVLPPISTKKTVVANAFGGGVRTDSNISNLQMTEVESLSSISTNLIENIGKDGALAKQKMKTKKIPVPQPCNLPGMYNNCDESSESDEDNTKQRVNNKNIRKLKVRAGWMGNDNYRCDSPGTAMRKMKEEGIIPKVKDIGQTREQSFQRHMQELEELGISRESIGSQSRPSNPKEVKITMVKPIDMDN